MSWVDGAGRVLKATFETNPAAGPAEQIAAAGSTARAPRDPSVTAEVVLTLVDLPEPPLRLFLDGYPYPIAENVYRQRLAIWRRWRELAEKE